MAKIALFLPNERNHKIILDTEEHRMPKRWTIGRSNSCDISFNPFGDHLTLEMSKAYRRCSANHAEIEAVPAEDEYEFDEDGQKRYYWRLRDVGSTNGTWLDGIRVGGKDVSTLWIFLEDNNVFWFGSPEVKIKVSFDLSDTLEIARHDTDPPQDEPGDAHEPTDTHSPTPASTSWQADLIRAIERTPNSRLVLYAILALSATVVIVVLFHP